MVLRRTCNLFDFWCIGELLWLATCVLEFIFWVYLCCCNWVCITILACWGTINESAFWCRCLDGWFIWVDTSITFFVIGSILTWVLSVKFLI